MKEIKPNDRNKKRYHYNPNATMKEVFKNIKIHLPKDYKFDHDFANSKMNIKTVICEKVQVLSGSLKLYISDDEKAFLQALLDDYKWIKAGQ